MDQPISDQPGPDQSHFDPSIPASDVLSASGREDQTAHPPIPLGTTREWYGTLLTMTEEGWRAEIKQNMHRRCKNWDYCKPWIYMVTIDTQHHDIAPYPIGSDGLPLMISAHDDSQGAVLSASGREGQDTYPYQLPVWLLREYAKAGHPHLFGELSPMLDANGQPFINLNAFGQAVDQEILHIPNYYPQVRIRGRIVMPNHLHFVIQIVSRLPEKKPLGFIINQFKSGVNRLYKQHLLGLPKETHMWVAGASPKLTASRAKSGGHGHKDPHIGLVLEEGFHDRILFREGQLERMLSYMQDNPRRLWEVVMHPENFQRMEHWVITMPRISGGGTKHAGRWWEYYPGGREALEAGELASTDVVLSASTGPVLSASGRKNMTGADEPLTARFLAPLITTPTSMSVTFNAMGNRSLLDIPERMQIQCSRRMSDAEVTSLISDVLIACQHGVVPISPCISPGEKAVARAVMTAGYKLVVLCPRGIPIHKPECKPEGMYFNACSRGQLLMLSPWEFDERIKEIRRWQCLLLNDLAAQLALEHAHGLRP